MTKNSGDFGLYIHWPFCESKCPYCDFNSHVRKTIDTDRWHQAFMQELKHMADQMPQGTLKSIFFGGGTPSLMDPRLVGDLIETAGRYWTTTPDMEITLEANPSSVERQKLVEFKAAGINRISIGIQSLRPEALKFLGRKHSRDEALAALKAAQKLFDKFSFDLIYARPQQGFKEWSQELIEALDYAQGHLSLYQLTIEEGTAFYHSFKRGDFSLPPQDTAAHFYELTQDIMTAHGMPAYEISNHALPGHESQHNLIYWRYGPFAALGPGAHGRIRTSEGAFALKRLKAPETWMAGVETLGHGTHTLDLLSKSEQFEECLMMGLRLQEGVLKSSLTAYDDHRLAGILNSDRFESLVTEGWMHNSPTHLQATPKGLLCLNTITQTLLK